MSNIAITISAAVLLVWIILVTIWCSIDSKKYKQYIDSIKIGDKFAMRGSFEKRSEPRIAEITDIKTNKIGEKYVQYRYIDGQPNLTYNRKIDIFIELFVRCND